MGHFYGLDGSMHYTVPKKDGSGERASHVGDARKNGWLPSITTVGKALRAPALEQWLIRTAVQAIVTAPDLPNETLDEKLVRVLETERQQDQEGDIAKDRGTQYHKILEDWFSGEAPVPDVYKPWLGPAIALVESNAPGVRHCERVLVGNGYAGRADLIVEGSDGFTVTDFKTCKTLPKRESWFDHKLQTAALAAALFKKESNAFVKDPVIRTANLYICTSEPAGQVAWFWNDPWRADADCFMHLLQVWKHQNNMP